MQTKQATHSVVAVCSGWLRVMAVGSLLLFNLTAQAQKKPSSGGLQLCVTLRQAAGDTLTHDTVAATYCDEGTGSIGDVNAEISSQGSFNFGTQPTIVGRGIYIDLGTEAGKPPKGTYDIALGTPPADCSCPDLGCDPSLAAGLNYLSMPMNLPTPVGIVLHLWPNPPLTVNTWTVVFGNWPEGCAKFPCAHGDYAWVTRTATYDWTFESFGDAPVCLLEQVPIGGKRVQFESRGQVFLTFQMSLTKK